MLKQAFLVAMSLVAAHVALERPMGAAPVRATLERLPLQVDAWMSSGQMPLDPRTLSVLGTTDYVNRAYRRGSDPAVDLYVGYYDQQHQASTIHSPLNCLPGSGWQVTARDTVRIGEAGPLVNRLRIRNEVSQLVVFYWYQSHGRVLASEYWSKAYLAFDAVRMRRTDGALVRVTTPVLEWDPNGEGTAERRAFRFVADLLPLLGQYIPA